MAKKSAVLRDEKRRKMYEKYKAKRAELKAAGDLEGLQMTRLYKSILNVKSADIGPESSLPPLFTVNTRLNGNGHARGFAGRIQRGRAAECRIADAAQRRDIRADFRDAACRGKLPHRRCRTRPE